MDSLINSNVCKSGLTSSSASPSIAARRLRAPASTPHVDQSEAPALFPGAPTELVDQSEKPTAFADALMAFFDQSETPMVFADAFRTSVSFAEDG